MSSITCHPHFDPWLAKILAQDCYKLEINEGPNSLPGENDKGMELSDVLSRSPVFVYAKVEPSAPTRIRFLEKLGFRLVDTSVTFSKPCTATQTLDSDHDVRFALDDDEEQVVALAGKNFSYSRFHLDDDFPEGTADRVKAEWARSYFKGKRGDAMVVAEADGRVVGFLQLISRAAERRLVIDLIAVDRSHRRQGTAARMIRFAENRFNDFDEILVGTQVANVPSLHFYGSLGFRISSAQYVFHYHH